MNDPTLLVDIGNTRAKWAFVERSATVLEHRDAASHAAFADALAAIAIAPRRIVVCNVAAPDVATPLARRWPDASLERFVATAHAGDLVNAYREPAGLGPDRWAALIGAHARHAGRDCLVCNFGTATTIDLLRADARQARAARFVGGLILPGVETMRRSLARDAARLPLAEGRVVDFATDTHDAIASGIAAAQAGAVERAVARARSSTLTIVLTGGHATAVAEALSPSLATRIEPTLVLDGLAEHARALR